MKRYSMALPALIRMAYNEAIKDNSWAVISLLEMALESSKDFEIVTCRDCAVPHHNGCSMLNDVVVTDDFYCGFGERIPDEVRKHREEKE